MIARSASAHSSGATAATRNRRRDALAGPRQVGDVGRREQPRLRAQQPGEPEQDEHRDPGARAARLDQQRREHEHEVGEVHVRAHAEREHRLAGDDQRGGQRPAAGPNHSAPEPVGDGAEQPEEAERGDHDHGLRAVAERREHEPRQRGQRVRRRRQRDAVVGQPAVGEVAAPDQRVGRVVVGEAAAHHRPRGEPAGPCEQREPDPLRDLRHARGRYPVPSPAPHPTEPGRRSRLVRSVPPASASLYRRHRPRTFADVVGQEHVVRTLRNAVEQGKVHHAYLFVGSRGTGKTSMAKILAACLNCVNGPTIEPCGVCESCVAIASATSLDVIEMDAASNNSVDDIRDLREKVAYAPVSGRHKVYILDEAHMLSTAAWNAFLKTLEEPPPHTIFVLATTEAAKVLPTVVDRCHRFDFARPTVAQITEVLRRVAAAESIEIPDAACALIARSATGSFRDALGTLEQLLAYSAPRLPSRTCWPCSAPPTPTCCSAPSTPWRPATRARRCSPRPGWPSRAATSGASSATSRRTRAG